MDEDLKKACDETLKLSVETLEVQERTMELIGCISAQLDQLIFALDPQILDPLFQEEEEEEPHREWSWRVDK